MTSLDEYLSRFSMHRKNSPCLTQSDSHLIKTKLEAIIKQALFHWKQNSVSSDQTRWISLLRACDGLWSDKYGENFHNANTSQNSSNLDDRAMRWWNVLSDSEAWWSNSRVISATASSDSRLFLLVEMPKQLFVPSDVLYWRYHDKRKIFLCLLSWCLKQSDEFQSVDIVPWCIGKPVLQLRLKNNHPPMDVILFPCCTEDSFSQVKNRKMRAWKKSDGYSNYYYMTTILEDLYVAQVFQHVTEQQQNNTLGWKRVIEFLEYWFASWHKKNDVLSVDVFLMSIWFLMDRIVTTKDNTQWRRLEERQLLEYCFHMLESQVEAMIQGSNGQYSLASSGISPLIYLFPWMDFIPFGDLKIENRVYGDLYHLYRAIQYTIRCFDIASSSLPRNTLGDWMLCTAFPFREEANLQTRRYPPLGQWDMFISVSMHQQHKEWSTIDYLSFYSNCYWILYQALWKRCIYISVVDTSSIFSPTRSTSWLLLGCRLHPQNAFVTVEKAIDENEKQHFRRFWKEKCELRRYRDGNIYESVVWSDEENLVDLQSLFHRICEEALVRNLPGNENNEDEQSQSPQRLFYMDIFCDLLHSLLPKSTSSSATSSWIIGFHKLTNWLRKLEDLPFDIHSIYVASDMFRGTSVISPDVWMNQATFRYIDAPRAIMIVESSMPWPRDDPQAQEMMRIGYYLVLKRCLQDQGIESCVDERGLDIVFEEYIYHFEIWTHQEYQQAWNTEKHRNTAIAIHLHYRLKYMTEREDCQSSFTDACRLAKRWLSCQMFSDYFSDEVIELLVARAYLDEMGSLDGDVPHSGLSGFYHFLYVLSLFATSANSISVPIPYDNNDVPSNDADDMSSPFRTIPHDDQVSSIYAQEQAHSFYWKLFDRFIYPLYRTSRGIPEYPILKRMGQVATITLQTLEQRIMSPNAWNVANLKILFRPDISVYDVLIVMRRKYLSRAQRYALDRCGEDTKKKYPTAKSIALDDLYVNIDPLEYFVQQLREKWGDLAFFFYDKVSCCVFMKKTMWRMCSMEVITLEYYGNQGRRGLFH